jgi:hypothetical protein
MTVLTTRIRLFWVVVENPPTLQAVEKFSRWMTRGGPKGFWAISGVFFTELKPRITKGHKAKSNSNVKII